MFCTFLLKTTNSVDVSCSTCLAHFAVFVHDFVRLWALVCLNTRATWAKKPVRSGLDQSIQLILGYGSFSLQEFAIVPMLPVSNPVMLLNVRLHSVCIS